MSSITRVLDKPPRGLPAAAIRSATPQEATARATALIVQGRSIDVGLMQINSVNLGRHGLTVATAFDGCRNMAAGADHYAADVQAVWALAHRRYNTGGTERGAAYAASVEQVLNRRVRTSAVPGRGPAAPEDTATPMPRRPPPGLQDALRVTPTVPDPEDGMADAFHRPTHKEPTP